jgi:hypothetical protein
MNQYPMAIYSPEGALSIVEDDEERAAIESTWFKPVAETNEAVESVIDEPDEGPDEIDGQGVVIKRGPGRPRKIQ